ncbi:HNH endonuclease [Gracilimonas halophila]|uniref:HNH endonuclease n=2 Tax=Gracilimonas halophila TaxID=1834464 RepID=A0ABW5JF21_9BACT
MDSSKMTSSHPDIIELSKLLNRLPIHDIRPDEVKFRNPNGVNLKLNNFKAFDPSYSGKGMENYGKLDKQVFDEFESDTDRLHKIAERIRAVSQDLDLAIELYKINEEDDRAFEIREGTVIYKLHKYRERDSDIIKRKKEREFQRLGRLPCEACTFDFYQKYGQLGYKYIECHHRTPLSEFSTSTTTTLKDLALVCSNCHRMLHRKVDTLSVEGLRNILAS